VPGQIFFLKKVPGQIFFLKRFEKNAIVLPWMKNRENDLNVNDKYKEALEILKWLQKKSGE
jgi:hypothetical protein